MLITERRRISDQVFNTSTEDLLKMYGKLVDPLAYGTYAQQEKKLSVLGVDDSRRYSLRGKLLRIHSARMQLGDV